MHYISSPPLWDYAVIYGQRMRDFMVDTDDPHQWKGWKQEDCQTLKGAKYMDYVLLELGPYLAKGCL